MTFPKDNSFCLSPQAANFPSIRATAQPANVYTSRCISTRNAKGGFNGFRFYGFISFRMKTMPEVALLWYGSHSTNPSR